MVSQNRAKERELANMIFAAKIIDLRLRNGYGDFSFHKL